MFIVTIYALIGDDIKLLSLARSADDTFMWLNVVAIILFIIELICSSVGVDGYFGSFFFWLDLISTLSIVTDIEPVMLRIVSGFDTSSEDRYIHEFHDDPSNPNNKNYIIETAQGVGGKTGGFKAGKLARIVRLIRLIRIVKLYKSATQRL